jgi:branched-chain amino acid transport system ATP-binding protein
MLEVNQLNVFYGNMHILFDIAISVKEGQLISIIGSNGAGKSTLLKTICGLIKPKTGYIKFKGKDIHGMPAYELVNYGITYIPEGGHIFPNMTVLENLQIGAYSKAAREKMNENLEFVYQLFPILKERKNQLAQTLSGGERQMLVIGRGLMANPALMLIDEPTLGLAPLLVRTTFETIKKLHEEKRAIILTEQNVKHALDISDYTYVIENGHIVASGTGKELEKNVDFRKHYLGIA